MVSVPQHRHSLISASTWRTTFSKTMSIFVRRTVLVAGRAENRFAGSLATDQAGCAEGALTSSGGSILMSLEDGKSRYQQIRGLTPYRVGSSAGQTRYSRDLNKLQENRAASTGTWAGGSYSLGVAVTGQLRPSRAIIPRRRPRLMPRARAVAETFQPWASSASTRLERSRCSKR